MKKFLGLYLVPTASLAWQTYVPPPPPRLPSVLSEKMVASGKLLFDKNVFNQGGVEIYNYLGNSSCGNCHDKPNPLIAKSVAEKFKEIREIINSEITKRMGGKELPPSDPAMESLVQYLIQRYKLQDYKLLK